VHGCSKEGNDQLEGTWTGLSVDCGTPSVIRDDEPIEETTFLFKGDKCIVTTKKKTTEMKYKVDESSEPKSIDYFITLDIGRIATWRGIYLVEGDKLTLCLTEKVGQDRPADFVIRNGETNGVFVFRRKK
jgi:uncharacterized protein (TIGR03067 family)